MTATLTTVNALLKEIYAPRVEAQLNEEQVAMKRIEKTADGIVTTVGGKYVDIPIHIRRNHGMGYREEEQQLPAAKRRGYAEVHVPLKYGYARVRFTGQLMKLAKTNTQAFANAMEEEMSGIKDDLAKDQNRIVYGTGSGQLAIVTDTDNADATYAVDSVQYLEVGMQVDVIDPTTGLPEHSSVEDVEITAVTETDPFTYTGTVTLSTQLGSGAFEGDEIIVRHGSYLLEPSGFGIIIDDEEEFHTLDPSTQPIWAASVMDNSGTPRALSESLMIQGVDLGRRKGGKVSAVFTSLGVRRAYFNLLTQQRRYADTKEFAGGFTGLAFNHGREIPVVEDTDAPPGIMWMPEEDKIKIYRDEPWHFMNEDGSELKWVHDYDVWEAGLRQFSEMGTGKRRAHVKIEDLIEA